MRNYNEQQRMIILDMQEVADTIIIENISHDTVLNGLIWVEDTCRAAGIENTSIVIDYTALPETIPCNYHGIIANQEG